MLRVAAARSCRCRVFATSSARRLGEITVIALYRRVRAEVPVGRCGHAADLPVRGEQHGNHILFTTGPVPNPRHEGASGSVTISGGSMVNDTTWHTLLTTWCPHFFGLYLDGNLVANSTAANTATSTAWSIFRIGWGFSTDQDFNGDIALIACFASSWTPAMVRRWHADPFGLLRPWNEVPALMGIAPPATPPSTGTGVITFLMG